MALMKRHHSVIKNSMLALWGVGGGWWGVGGSVLLIHADSLWSGTLENRSFLTTKTKLTGVRQCYRCF